MDYIKLTVTYSSSIADISEIIIAELAEIDFDSFTEEIGEILAFIPSPLFDIAKIDALFAGLYQRIDSFKVSTQIEEVKAENWNKNWESSFEPVIVGSQCIVRAPFHTSDKKYEYEIIIEPKMSFGTRQRA